MSEPEKTYKVSLKVDGPNGFEYEGDVEYVYLAIRKPESATLDMHRSGGTVADSLTVGGETMRVAMVDGIENAFPPERPDLRYSKAREMAFEVIQNTTRLMVGMVDVFRGAMERALIAETLGATAPADPTEQH